MDWSIPQVQQLPVFAFWQINGCTDNPPFRFERLCDPIQSGKAVYTVIRDRFVIGIDHASDFPIARTFDTVDIIYNQL